MGTPAADARGHEAKSLVSDLLDLPRGERRTWYSTLAQEELALVLVRCRIDLGTRYGLWQDDPVGFIEDVIGDRLWAKQREIAEAVADNARVVVPATHAPGKTFLGGDLAVWFGSVWPIGTALVATTAPLMRQVKGQMWPGIRRAHRKAGIPGQVLQAMWYADDELRTQVGFGFSPAEGNEVAASGEHRWHVLLIVDEGGGIGHTLGRAYEAFMTNPDAHELVIGNPPTDEEGSWMEGLVSAEHLWHVERLSAYDTPNFTGEVTPRCTSCPQGVPPHRVAMHLTTTDWVEEVVREYGEESSFVVARVLAMFPQFTGNKVMPLPWVEAAAEADHEPRGGYGIRLGADIASDGGDEVAVARAVGYRVRIVHNSSGPGNADPVAVAGLIWHQVTEALELRDRLTAEHGPQPRIRVKIDAEGLGWGVAGLVKRWAQEKNLPVDVVPVFAHEPPHAPDRFINQRSEMWWNTRNLIKPVVDPLTGERTAGGAVLLEHASHRLKAQLSGPRYTNNSSGHTVVEKKKDMRRRGLSSPDQADAVNLALYEPPGQSKAKVKRPEGVRTPTGPRPAKPPGSGGGGRIVRPGQGGTVTPMRPRRA